MAPIKPLYLIVQLSRDRKKPNANFWAEQFVLDIVGTFFVLGIKTRSLLIYMLCTLLESVRPDQKS